MLVIVAILLAYAQVTSSTWIYVFTGPSTGPTAVPNGEPDGAFKRPQAALDRNKESDMHDISNNFIWAPGSSQVIEWTWNYSCKNYTMYLYQVDWHAEFLKYTQGDAIHSARCPENNFGWTATPSSFQLSFSEIFFLEVEFQVDEETHGNANRYFRSHYFNMTDTKANSSAAGFAISTTMVSPTITTDFTATATAPPMNHEGPLPHSYSLGAAIGLGIGMVILILLLVVAVFFYMRGRRRQTSTTNIAPASEQAEHPPLTSPEKSKREASSPVVLESPPQRWELD